MRKLIITIVMLIVILIPTRVKALENNQVRLYFFHGDGCSHCAEEETYLATIKRKYNNVEIYSYEVWSNDDNNSKMMMVKEKFAVNSKGVPFTVIGEQYFLGFSEITGSKMEEVIMRLSKKTYTDDVGVMLGIIGDKNQGQDLITDDKLEQVIEDKKTDDKENNFNKKVIIPSIIVSTVGGLTFAITGIIIYFKKRGC